MSDKTKLDLNPASASEAKPEQTVEEAVAAVDAAKDAGQPLTEPQAKVADANRATVLEAITSLDTSTKGATAAIFAVMRSSVSASEATLILSHLEFQWRQQNDQQPIPASWRSTKSPMLKAFENLPQLIKDARVANEINLTRASVHDKAERDRRTAILFLDDDAKLQPLAFGPKGYSDWKNALSALTKCIAASKVQPGKSKSDAEPETIPEFDMAAYAPEVKQVTMRFLRAVKAANGNVPHPELVNMIREACERVEKRIESAKSKRAA